MKNVFNEIFNICIPESVTFDMYTISLPLNKVIERHCKRFSKKKRLLKMQLKKKLESFKVQL